MRQRKQSRREHTGETGRCARVLSTSKEIVKREKVEEKNRWK